MSQGPNTAHGMCKEPAHLILDQANASKFLILSILWRVKGGEQAASSRPFITVNTSIMPSVVTHWESKQTGRWNPKRLVIEVLTGSSINFSQNGMKSVEERKKNSESSTVSSMTCCVKWAFKGKIISLCNADILLSYLFYDKKALYCVNEYEFSTFK